MANLKTQKKSTSSTRDVRPSKQHPKSSKSNGLLQEWRHVSARHSWFNPLITIMTIVAGYLAWPGQSNPILPLIFLSYPDTTASYLDRGTPIMYGKGLQDLKFVGFYTVVFTFTRQFIMEALLRPLASSLGIKNRGKQLRFMEQTYTAVYMAVFGTFGLYVASRTPIWFFNTRAMFEGYPHRYHEGPFKAYYLLQASYWAQQALVMILGLEKPRKDFNELVTHHILAILLIGLSYSCHFTYMGLPVYITHDISDLFLALTKVFNYLNLTPILFAPFFGLYACIWVYSRHYLNLRILWATLTEFQTIGPFELNWQTGEYKCRASQIITFSLLACLQVLNCIWLLWVLRTLRNYLFRGTRSDERSEDENEDEGQKKED